jgi:hypothetical protein
MDDQTVGEITGSTVSSSAVTPRAASAARLGSRPPASSGSITLQLAPSTPTRNTRPASGLVLLATDSSALDGNTEKKDG